MLLGVLLEPPRPDFLLLRFRQGTPTGPVGDPAVVGVHRGSVDALTTTAAAQEAGCIHGAATALLAVLGELALGPPSVAGLASPVDHPVTVVLRRDAQCHDPRRDLRERHLKLDQTLRRAHLPLAHGLFRHKN